MTENLAKFTINGSPSVDPVTGDKGYQTTALATLTLTLEQVPSAALSVTYYVYSSTDESSPLASKDAPALTFTASGTYMDTPASPNGTVELVMPATAAHSWNVRCVAATADGSDEYVRQVCIPYTLGVTDIFKTVPEETDEFYARGWSDKFNDYLAYIALFTIPTLDVSYDAGGAGLGRVVTVDSGAIEFNGSNAADYTLEVSNSGNGGVLYMDNTGTGRTFDIRIGGVASLVLDGTNNFSATCATLSLEATGAVALSSSAGLLSLSDGFQAGSTYASDLVLSDASAEWDLFEVNFGEVSILNAFNQCASSAVTLDEAYNASAGPSTITVDAGDVTWNEVGAYSFVVGLSGCTGAADGFFVDDGTDYFRLTHAAANTLNLGAQLADVAIDALTISLDSVDDSNFSISANDAGVITLTLECTNVGAGTAEIDINADDAIMIDSASAGISFDCVTSANFTITATSAIAETLTFEATNAGAGTANVDINADDAITLDSTNAGISLDAVTSSNFSITDNSVNVRTLTLSATNAGAGKAYVDIYSDDETKLRSTAGTVLIDAASNLELNSSGGPINIGHDAVNQNINIGTAGARPIVIGSATATAITLDAVGGISLDAADTSDFVVQANSVANKYLMMSVSNSGGGDSTLYLLSDDVGGGGACNMVVRAGTNITIDAGGVLELNSSAGVIGIGNDAVNQAINLGTAGARTIALGSATATAVTLDAVALSLDASDTSNFTVAMTSAAAKDLYIHLENLGAGVGSVTVVAGDRVCVSNHTLTLAAYGPAGSLVDIVSDGDIHTSSTGDTAIAANADITFTGNGAAPTAFNDVTDTVLVGFASASIIGALNELKEGYLACGIHDVNAAAYAFNDFTVSALHVSYSATGACTITIDSDQIAVSGRTFTIVDTGLNAGANNITVETEGAETIHKKANLVMTSDGMAVTLQSDGSNLWII